MLHPKDDEEWDESLMEISVADVRLAYKNRSLINLLLKRGALIGADKPFDQINDADE